MYEDMDKCYVLIKISIRDFYMKVFVTGVNGQLGFETVKELSARGIECVGSDISDAFCGEVEAFSGFSYIKLDITDRKQVLDVITKINPDAVIHPAGWTAVDSAEEPGNREMVFDVNEKGTEYIAEACSKISSKMLYISTDYVFDGHGSEPWKPDDKNFNPLSVYGASKLAGEKAVARLTDKFFIVRISWAFAINGNNFVRTMLNIAQRHDTVRVVNDQIGTPTYMHDLARLLVDMIETDRYGYYHATNEGGFISWYDFAVEIYRQTGKNIKVIPVSTDEYGYSKAIRPKNSRLDKSKLAEAGFEPLPDWKDALSRYLDEYHKR